MRKSVTRRLTALPTPTRQSFLRRHIVIIIAIPVLIFTAVGAHYYLAQQEQASAHARTELQAKRIATVTLETKKALQKKIDDARAAEDAARKQAADEEAKRKAEAAAKPAGTSTSRACGVKNPDSITVIINKKHCFSPIDWAPSDIASVGGYPMRAEAANQMIAMMNAASAAGVGFELSSAYRSYSNQVTVYNHWVAVNGSQAAADTVSARPGYSEHQTGLVADLKVGGCVLECFAGSPQHTWLAEHGAEYGYIQRYPVGLSSITGYSPEAWHWRYVGVAVAQDLKTKGIQTLEQYYGIAGGDYS